VVGSNSGPHAGQARLSDDGVTVIFKPATPFASGEQVSVTVTSGLAIQSGAVFGGLQSSFTISGAGSMAAVERAAASDGEASGQPPAAPNGPGGLAAHPQDYVTFPDDFPAYTITVPANGTAPGLLFLAPFRPFMGGPSYLFMADDTGEPVYWQAFPPGAQAVDFKRQPNGWLTYFLSSDLRFHALDNTYTEVATFASGNGYQTDQHELQVLPNGHVLLMSYDAELVDMSVITTGGQTTATVVGLVVQELDLNQDVVFQFRSWDHFKITDTVVSLTTGLVDYVHGNAIELDHDNDLLLSSRHLNEITKIDHETGDIIWRLGGNNNQFTIYDPDGPFAFQHDIRRLPNGDITLFDNHYPGPFSRAVEFQLDEFHRTADNVWQYRNTPDEFNVATGSNQRLPDGHRLIGWGFGQPDVTEVLTDGTKLFEMALDPPYLSYRAFRFPWAAVPAWDPTLVVITNTLTPTLYYSWNGATDVASYEIYGSFGATPTTLVRTQARTGFEDHTTLTGMPAGDCAFRIRPIDHAGQPQRFSNVVYTKEACTEHDYYLPLIFGP
jgi:hypothetical protein